MSIVASHEKSKEDKSYLGVSFMINAPYLDLYDVLVFVDVIYHGARLFFHRFGLGLPVFNVSINILDMLYRQVSKWQRSNYSCNYIPRSNFLTLHTVFSFLLLFSSF
jgi:hypothetical protein